MSGTLKVRNAVPHVRRGGTKTATLSNTRSLSSNNIIFKISEIPGSQDSREGTITFVNESTGITREINVKQINPFCVKTESIEILEGETANIELINNLEDKSVEWSSSNTSIATVDENGKIDAISKGSCTITIKSFDKKYTRVCVVSVKSITDYVKSKVMTVQFGSLSNGYFSGKISSKISNESGRTIILKELQIVGNYTVFGTIDEKLYNGNEVTYTITVTYPIYKPFVRWVYTYNNKEYYSDCYSTLW
jgi:hypothetical protein